MDVHGKSEIVDELIAKYQGQVSNSLGKFINTHDLKLVNSFYTNTVLTPTEVASIVTKVQEQTLAITK